MTWVYAQLSLLLGYLTWTAYTMRAWDTVALFGLFAFLAAWAGIRRFRKARAAAKLLAAPLAGPKLPDSSS